MNIRIGEFLDIIRRKNVEKKPSKEFVDILISNIEKIKDILMNTLIFFLITI